MGQAKRRGTFEQRQAEAIERNYIAAEARAAEEAQWRAERALQKAAKARAYSDREAMGINTVADRQLECERKQYAGSRYRGRMLLPMMIGMGLFNGNL